MVRRVQNIGTLRAAENSIKTPFYPTGKVDRVNQPGF